MAGERPSRSAFAIYSSATAPNVVAAATLLAMRSRRFVTLGSLPVLAAIRAASRALRASLNVSVGYLPSASFRSTPCIRYFSRHSRPPAGVTNKIQAPTVGQLVGPVARLRVPDCRIRQRHPGALPCQTEGPPKRPPLRAGCRHASANSRERSGWKYEPFWGLSIVREHLRTARWCPGEDSNLHGLRHWYLKPARLPIPPPGHAIGMARFV